MVDCIFCAIAAGEAPATIVDGDDCTVAFMDINPWRRGHALAIPRRHYRDLLEIEPDGLSKTFEAARRLAAVMKDRFGAEDVVVWNSCGRSAGQVVMHFHLHVVPTAAGDLRLPRHEDLADPVAIAEAAAVLRGE